MCNRKSIVQSRFQNWKFSVEFRNVRISRTFDTWFTCQKNVVTFNYTLSIAHSLCKLAVGVPRLFQLFWKLLNLPWCNLWPFGYVFCHTAIATLFCRTTNNGKRLIFLDKVQKSIWGPVKWQVISAILILFNVYGFSNKSSPEIIKLSLNPFITNAPSVSDGPCETKYTVHLVNFLKKVANTMSTLIGKPGKLIRIFFRNFSFWVWHRPISGKLIPTV